MSNHPPTKEYALFDPTTKLPGVGFTRTYCETGTNNAKDTFYDPDLAPGHENANPVTSDANGQYPEIHLKTDGAYRIIEKNAAGAVLRTTDDVWANRVASDGTYSGTSSDATPAISGTNTGAGPGVKGITTGGTGPAGYFHADTSSPVSPAIHAEPQNPDPSAPLKGALYPNSVSGGWSCYDGTAWRRLVGKVYSNTATEEKACPGTFTPTWTLPAGSLRQGTIVRVRVSLKVSAQMDGPLATGSIYLAGVQIADAICPSACAVGDSMVIDAVISILTTGAGGTYAYSGTSIGWDLSVATAYPREMVGQNAIDTTVANLIDVRCTRVGGTSASVTLYQLIVEIAD